MGILNVTGDSFYENSRFLNLEKAILRGQEMASQGSDIIDIGGESTRPGAQPINAEEEEQRVIPLIQALHSQLSTPLSIDTMKPSVAVKAIEAGASLLNDVSGLADPQMREIAASTGVDVCVMHMQGTPQTMQANPVYEEGIVSHLLNWFEKRLNLLMQAGISSQKITLDPGIGFGKTVAHNLEILHNLPRLKALGFPVLLGVSRKSFLSKILGLSPHELLPATIAVNAFAIQQGVDIIRVHDVKEHRSVIDLITHPFFRS